MDLIKRRGKRGEPGRRRRSKPAYFTHPKELAKNANQGKRIKQVRGKEATCSPPEKLAGYLRQIGEILKKFPWER
jgi:hypothetical protein